jgi:acyl carrier protein
MPATTPPSREERMRLTKEILLRDARSDLHVDELPGSARIAGQILGLSSLTLMGVFVALESEFVIRFSDEVFAIARLETVDDVLALVETEYARAQKGK